MRKDLIEEKLDEQKPSNWKRVVIIAGALIGGLAGWYFGGQTPPVYDIVVGIIAGTFLTDWVLEKDLWERPD